MKLTLRMNRFFGNFGTDHHHHVYSLPCAASLGPSVNFSHGSSTSFFHLDDGGMAAVYDIHCRHSRTCYGLHLFAKWSYAVQGGKPVPAGQPQPCSRRRTTQPSELQCLWHRLRTGLRVQEQVPGLQKLHMLHPTRQQQAVLRCGSGPGHHVRILQHQMLLRVHLLQRGVRQPPERC